MYRKILGPVCDNEKENWRILTNNEIYAMVKKVTTTETISLNTFCWYGHTQRMEENRIPIKVLYVNLETTRLRGRPRFRWQDEVRMEDWLVEKGGRKGNITERNGRTPENGKGLSHSAHAHGMK